MGFSNSASARTRPPPTNQLTDECFDKNLLQLEDGTTRYILGAATGVPNGPVNLRLRLPAGVSCQYCVLQMWWKTNSNNNGCNSTDVGCGNQEQYKNCADVAIMSTSTFSQTSTTPPTSTTTTRFPPCFGRTTCVGTTTTSTTTTAPPVFIQSTSHCLLKIQIFDS